MLADLTEQEPPSRLYVESFFEAAIHRVIRVATNASDTIAAGRQALTPLKLRRVKAYIEDHLDQELDLQSLADLVGLSRFHFCRAFQQTTWYPPYAFVTRARIARAKAALVETDAPIAEVARLSGYNSAAHFASTFRKMTGVSPREWHSRL